tara:strand:+ start:58 stop:783 length:726 start_codon:yes stop_codon:yes gene_type:complete
MIRARKKHQLFLPLVAACLTLIMLVTAKVYREQSRTLLPPLTRQLGTVAMELGTRSEGAGDLPGALAHYLDALQGVLHGEQDRVHVEKRCGVLYWKLGDAEMAIPHLIRAQESSLRSLNGYRPLVESLLAVGRVAEANTCVQRWILEAEDAPRSLADALQMLGRLAVISGAPDQARKNVTAAQKLVEGHESLVDRARRQADGGDLNGAISSMERYLSSAPPGVTADEGWELLATWKALRSQ